MAIHPDNHITESSGGDASPAYLVATHDYMTAGQKRYRHALLGRRRCYCLDVFLRWLGQLHAMKLHKHPLDAFPCAVALGLNFYRALIIAPVRHKAKSYAAYARRARSLISIRTDYTWDRGLNMRAPQCR